jgi:broad specificity phosphatase PhoE
MLIVPSTLITKIILIALFITGVSSFTVRNKSFYHQFVYDYRNRLMMVSSEPFTNHLLPVNNLKNHYFALRHGQSLANVGGIIASNPDVACASYGLSDVGKQQAEKAGLAVVEKYMACVEDATATAAGLPLSPPTGIAIVTSDLLRAKETAEIVATAVRNSNTTSSTTIPLYKNGIVIDTRLRERGFGTWDGGSDIHYQDVWNDDANDPSHVNGNVESVMSVMDRATQCIIDWDSDVVHQFGSSSNWMVICVAHGDVLQILQTAFCKMDPSQHRSLQHLETATLRSLTLAKPSHE